MPLQPADKQLLADRDPTRRLFGDDGQARDEAGECGVPPFGLAWTERTGVVQPNRMERPLTADGWRALTS